MKMKFTPDLFFFKIVLIDCDLNFLNVMLND